MDDSVAYDDEEEILDETHRVLLYRRPKKYGIIKYALFLVLYNARRPVIFMSGIMGVAGIVNLIFWSANYMLNGREGMPLLFGVPIIMMSITMILGYFYVPWYYDLLVLRLVPPGIKLRLFD
ncbi:hypothetical protein [Bartonella phoceensis]|uniref:hypothetical protein n=1 Tax=Bartonella phoceensis TaxID=270249 RepID=UPI001ABA9AEF|nr:hypothetical protein [Bartonella phoceensis]